MHHLTIGSNTYEVVDQAGRASIAPDYDSTSTYAVGDLVLHEGQLYECSSAISTAEAWTAAHWTSKTVAAEVTSLIGDLNGKLDEPSTAGTNGQVLATDGDGGTYWTNSGGGGSSPSPYTSNPSALGTASPGSSDAYARGDHVHPMPSAANVGAIALPSNPSTNDFLVFNGSAWVAQSLSAWQGGSY